MPLCQAIFCSNRRGNCPGKSFFAIPDPQKDRGRCALWLRNLGTTKLDIKTYKYSRHRVVCEDHFEESAIEEDRQALFLGCKPRKMLKRDAIPTVFKHRSYSNPPRPTSIRRHEERKRREVLSCIDNEIHVQGTSQEQCGHLLMDDSMTTDITDVPEAIEEVEVLCEKVVLHKSKKKRVRKRNVRTDVYLADCAAQTDITAVIGTVDSSTQTSSDVLEYGTQMPINVLGPSELVAEFHQYSKSATEQQVPADGSQSNDQSIHRVHPTDEQAESSNHEKKSNPSLPISDPNMQTDSSDTDPGEDEVDSDPTYQPEEESSSTDDEEDLEEAYVTMKKYIVFEHNLNELFYRLTCPTCHTAVSELKQIPCGSMLKVHGFCRSGHLVINWSSQPLINRTGVGNLLLAGATLFSGLTHKRVEDFANYAGIQYICESSFYKYQKSILLPVINAQYIASQETALENARYAILEGKPLIISGDGRCDSPGHNAKFGTYSMMNTSTNEILCHALVQVTQATSSNAMEKVGFVQCMEKMESENVQVSVMATDRHVSIRAALKKDYKHITHQFDVWHLSKSIKKKLLEKSKRKGCEPLSRWIQATSNHLWWAASSCDQNPDLLVEKFTSITHHVTDSHQWTHGELFKCCAHDALTEQQRSSVAWLEAGSPAHEALVSVVLDKTILRDIRQLTMALNTGRLEQYHGLMLRYCPKRQAFDYPSMQARTQMAVIDHNHNAERPHALDKKGCKKYTAVYQKATKKWVLRARYVKKNYSFIKDMMKNVVSVKLGNLQLAEPDTPCLPKNIAPVPCPDKEEMKRNHRSRFPDKD